ncbi:MAG: hypothetical protein JWR68_3111 [Polaromonas sp.]|nr:hypothetical protein [Polaromonas sp.]
MGLTGLCPVVTAQTIYSCVDAKGRAITADRPIPECIDRTQRELSSTGLVKRHLGPTLTAHEQAAQEAKDKQAADLRARELEEKRRERALVQRYPTRAIHDRERAAALVQVDEVIQASLKRRGELAEEGKAIASELEFYAKDPSKAPGTLKRRLEENQGSMAVQHKFIFEQQLEKKRVGLRFDEELARLQQLWALTSPPVAAAASSPKPAKH